MGRVLLVKGNGAIKTGFPLPDNVQQGSAAAHVDQQDPS